MNISDLKEGLKFKCKYMNEVKHGLIGVHRKGMEGECPILTIYDVKVSNSGIIHVPVYPPKGQDLEYFLDDNKITDFELLPEGNISEVQWEGFKIKGDNNRIENSFFSFHKPVPKNHIVSLVFNNNKGVINTVDVVSATCEHEAIGAAIEKQMKIHSGLIVYTVVPYELEDNSNTK